MKSSLDVRLQLNTFWSQSDSRNLPQPSKVTKQKMATTDIELKVCVVVAESHSEHITLTANTSHFATLIVDSSI